MSQTPHPHDPYAQQPAAAEPHAAAPAADASEQGAPTSDPALHPHDPYAVAADAPRSNPLDIDAEPAPQQTPPAHDPYATPQAQYAQQAPSAQQSPYGPGAAQGGTVPPAGTAGVHDGPLTGQAVSESDSRMWATVAQALVAGGHVISWGFLGWAGPVVIFLTDKDRDRVARFHHAEALNGAIAVLVAQIVLGVAITILTIFTLGLASFMYPLVGVPALLQLVFAIIGAVKAHQGEYWKYPFNIRLIK